MGRIGTVNAGKLAGQKRLDQKLSARAGESDIETNAIDSQAFAVDASAEPLGLRLHGPPESFFRRSADAHFFVFFPDLLSATSHIGGRSRATHARSHPNTLARRHTFAAKQWAAAKRPALRNSPTPQELHRQELAQRRLAVVYKPELHR